MKSHQIAPGTIIHSWTVVRAASPRGYRRYWHCRCVCGRERDVWEENLARGVSKACGCTSKRKTHGHSPMGIRSPTMTSYGSMLARCSHPSNPAFVHYQRRGITICDRWRDGEDGKTGFECFLADMGVRPSRLLSIERIDNSKGYSPDNCRWASKREQARNRTTTTLYPCRGQQMTLREIAETYGFRYETLRYRVSRAGLTAEEALALGPDRRVIPPHELRERRQ